MPRAAPKPCTYPGCARGVQGGGTRCSEHPYVNRFADKRRGSRQSRGYDAAWERRRERVLYRDHGLCQCCLKRDQVTIATEVDHIVNKAEARRLGWTNEQIEADENLQAICNPCHVAKTAREARIARDGTPPSRG